MCSFWLGWRPLRHRTGEVSIVKLVGTYRIVTPRGTFVTIATPTTTALTAPRTPDESVEGSRRSRVVGPESCPITPVVDLVFSRWTTPILWKLNEHGRQRFVEIQRNVGTITAKVLTQRLRQLERDGLVVRSYFPEVPPRVEYEITDLGRSLAPVFASLVTWSGEHLGEVETARAEFDASGRPHA